MTPGPVDADSGANSEGGAGGQPGNEPEFPVVNPLPACVPVPVEGGTKDSGCPAVSIFIDPTITGPICALGGFTIEPLQVPDFSMGVLADPANAPYTEPDPANWDRSVTPAGAYVFRVHGLRAACYPAGGRFSLGTCLDDFTAIPASFYERHCSEAPGCSTPEKVAFSAASSTDDSGYWWYLDDVDDSALDVVVCAPEVSSYASGGCLQLEPKLRCGDF